MISRRKLDEALTRERDLFRATHPESAKIYKYGKKNLLYGVPMNWMQMWPGGFPITVREGRDALIRDVDGHEYADFCLGYSAAANGHAPREVIDAVAGQMEKGSVYTLPSENSYEAGRELESRFGLPVWGFALSATDANRFVLRICREITRRRKILVFNGCYHGTVSECFATEDDGRTVNRTGNLGAPFDAGDTTFVVEFNDFEALERVLRTEEIACLLMEPVMTNIGIIHPEPGFLEACRRLTQETGTLWIIDEAHTLTAGPSGYSGKAGLHPDVLVLGKCIGGGFPAGCYGMTGEVSERLYRKSKVEYADTSGIGGTMTGSPVAMAAILATLKYCLTEEAFTKSVALADEFAAGVERTIKRHGLPFCTNKVGARAEYLFAPAPPKNAAESLSTADHDLYEYFFVASMNRGLLLSPYFNIMASFSSSTRLADVKRHEAAFEDAVCAII